MFPNKYKKEGDAFRPNPMILLIGQQSEGHRFEGSLRLCETIANLKGRR